MFFSYFYLIYDLIRLYLWNLFRENYIFYITNILTNHYQHVL